jgi:hypothetical protein
MSVRGAVKQAPEHQMLPMGCIVEANIARARPMDAAALDMSGAHSAEIGGQIAFSVYGSLQGKQ